MSAPSSMPSGWFPDPHGRFEHRWFNGMAWTADVAADGNRFVDPLGAAPAPGAQRGDQPGNAPATAALTLGMLALLLAWLPFVAVVGFVLAILAIVYGVRGRRRSVVVGSGHTMAVAGLVTGSFALALSIVGFALTVSSVSEVVDFVEPGPHDAAVLACTIDAVTISVSATVTNRDDRARSYTVYAVVTKPARLDDIVLEIDSVRPGETREIELTDTVASTGDCAARLVVHGPRPFGWNVERWRD